MATRQGAAVDKWPAAARLWTVATAGHLPTAVIHHDWGHGLARRQTFAQVWRQTAHMSAWVGTASFRICVVGPLGLLAELRWSRSSGDAGGAYREQCRCLNCAFTPGFWAAIFEKPEDQPTTQGRSIQ